MYLRFAAKRIFWGVMSYVFIISMYSCILNTKIEVTAWADVHMMVQGYMMSPAIQKISPEELPQVKAEVTEMAKAAFGLDKPLYIRIFNRIKDALVFNFGNIKQEDRDRPNPIKYQLMEAFNHTMKLFVFSTVISFWVGLLIGKLKAVYRNSSFDKTTSIMTFFFYGTPSWWIANILIYFFVYENRIMPFAQFHTRPFIQNPILFFLDSMYYLILPIATLIITGIWGTAYIVKNILLTNLEEDYVMSARARGIPERKVVHDHALKAAAPPIVTMGLTALATSFAGDIIIEIIFAYPGLGLMLWEAIKWNRIHHMMAVLCCITMIYCAILIILDLIYGFLDPRINYGRR
jgi:peptide/nickel transport system permease protein